MLQCKAICCSDRTKRGEQEQAYAHGSTPSNVNKTETRYTAASCNKWARELKNMAIIFNIYSYDFFSNFSLCWSVKNKSLSIQMVRETGSLSKIPLPVAVFSCFCFLIFGKSSVFVVHGVECHKSAWLFRTNETASNTHMSWTFLVPPSQPPFGTTFYSSLHKRMNHVVVCEVRRWYSVTFNLLYPKYGTQWASEGYKRIIE